MPCGPPGPDSLLSAALVATLLSGAATRHHAAFHVPLMERRGPFRCRAVRRSPAARLRTARRPIPSRPPPAHDTRGLRSPCSNCSRGDLVAAACWRSGALPVAVVLQPRSRAQRSARARHGQAISGRARGRARPRLLLGAHSPLLGPSPAPRAGSVRALLAATTFVFFQRSSDDARLRVASFLLRRRAASHAGVIRGCADRFLLLPPRRGRVSRRGSGTSRECAHVPRLGGH